MNFPLKASLEHMALLRIAISLWNQKDVLALQRAVILSFIPDPLEWEKIEERVIEKAQQLSLPKLIKEKVLGVIKPIGMKIFRWIRNYRKKEKWIGTDYERDIHTDLPPEFFWTSQCTIDVKKTAETLIRKETFDVHRCYRLACEYCLEDDIRRLWKKLPKKLKQNLNEYPVTRFWTDYMKRRRAGHTSFKKEFYKSVQDANKIASKYFLERLTLQEREESLKCIDNYVEPDFLLFLLQELKEEERVKILKNIPCEVLYCFLEWPWQKYYIDVANCMWNFLSSKDFAWILGDIIWKVRRGYKDYNYQGLFLEFLHKSPSALKDSFIETFNDNMEMPDLCHLNYSKSIMYNINVINQLIYTICHGDWDMLEFYLQECLPSKEAVLKFKTEFDKYYSNCLKNHFEAK